MLEVKDSGMGAGAGLMRLVMLGLVRLPCRR